MAIIDATCPACGETFKATTLSANREAKCPGCGKSFRLDKEHVSRIDKRELLCVHPKKWYRTRYGLLFIFFVLVFFLYIFDYDPMGHSTNTDAKKQKAIDNAAMAWAMSHSFVKPMLKAPLTAKFGPFDESVITNLGDGKYKVVAYVDSQNTFGAMLRNYYACELKCEPDLKTWKMLNIDFKN